MLSFPPEAEAVPLGTVPHSLRHCKLGRIWKFVMRFARAIFLAVLSTGASAIVKWSYQQPVHNGNLNVDRVQRPGVVYAPTENSSVERDRGRESSRIRVREAPSGAGRRTF